MPYSTKRPIPESAILKSKLRDMLRRCLNKNRLDYKSYGGRGIYVCDEWRYNRDAFVRWAKENGFRPGLSIDRIDNDGPYSPWNCRFVDNTIQQNNKTTSVLITVGDITATLSQWAKLIDRPVSALYALNSEGIRDIRWFLESRWNMTNEDDKKRRLSEIAI